MTQPACATARPDGRTNAWDTRWWWWHAGFALVLVVAVVVLVIDDESPTRTLAGVALAIALGIVYATVGVRAIAGRPESLRAHLLYAVPALALVGALLATSPVFFLLLWALYPQIFATSPTLRVSVVTALLLSIVLTTAAAGWTSTPFSGSAWWSGALQGAIGLVFSVCFGTWITRIIDESRARADLIDELAATRAQLAAAHREAGKLGERERLAAEIHDTLAQGFASIAMLLQAADASIERDAPAARAHIATAQRTARENLAEARALVAALQPVALQSASLPDAVARLAERCREEAGLDVTVEVTGDIHQLEPNDEVALLRAAQESLSNVRKHASATRVSIVLAYGPDATTLTIDDDGRGFDPDSIDGGFGLRGLRNRLEQVGGSAAVASATGSGTRVTVTVHP